MITSTNEEEEDVNPSTFTTRKSFRNSSIPQGRPNTELMWLQHVKRRRAQTRPTLLLLTGTTMGKKSAPRFRTLWEKTPPRNCRASLGRGPWSASAFILGINTFEFRAGSFVQKRERTHVGTLLLSKSLRAQIFPSLSWPYNSTIYHFSSCCILFQSQWIAVKDLW